MFKRTPITVTAFGLFVLRLRLSLRESKGEFGRRLKVTRKTIRYWEHGYTECSPIYRTMLDALYTKLSLGGLLIPESVAQLEMAKLIKIHGDSEDRPLAPLLEDTPLNVGASTTGASD